MKSPGFLLLLAIIDLDGGEINFELCQSIAGPIDMRITD